MNRFPFSTRPPVHSLLQPRFRSPASSEVREVAEAAISEPPYPMRNGKSDMTSNDAEWNYEMFLMKLDEDED